MFVCCVQYLAGGRRQEAWGEGKGVGLGAGACCLPWLLALPGDGVKLWD